MVGEKERGSVGGTSDIKLCTRDYRINENGQILGSQLLFKPG